MTQLSGSSLPSLSTSVLLMLSRPSRWGAWRSDSDLERIWFSDVVTADLEPMREQLSCLSNALESVICMRRDGASREALQAQAQSLRDAVQRHQSFLNTLGSDWHALPEFPSYQHLLREFQNAAYAWQQAVLLNDPQELAHFHHGEQLGWKLLGEAAIVMDMFIRGMAFREPEDEVLPSVLDGASSVVRQLLERWRLWRASSRP